jgi:hypothetical protein
MSLITITHYLIRCEACEEVFGVSFGEYIYEDTMNGIYFDAIRAGWFINEDRALCPKHKKEEDWFVPMINLQTFGFKMLCKFLNYLTTEQSETMEKLYHHWINNEARKREKGDKNV